MSHPVIRPAGQGDIGALSELASRTWSDAFGHSVDPVEAAAELEQTRSKRYFEDALRQRTILVAESGGVLVGYVQFGEVEIPEVDARPGDQELQRVYVETKLQGRGIGRSLMTAALEHPRLAGASHVYLQVWERNEPAVRLYESLGFRTVGTTSFTIGSGEAVEDLVMVLDQAGRP